MRVSVEQDGRVAVVTLTRPEKHNAIDAEMLEALAAAGETLAASRELRAVVLTGAGRSFCSGLDIPSFVRAGADLRAMLAEPPPNRFQRAACVWLELPVPVIAAVHGNCIGGGLQIALAADIRLAAADARLSLAEVRWGLVPDMAITATLPRLVGVDVAKELTYTARTLESEEAARLGLITRVVEDPLAQARALAAEIAERSPDAVRAAKRLLDEGWHAGRKEGLALEARLQLELVAGAVQAAGQGLEP